MPTLSPSSRNRSRLHLRPAWRSPRSWKSCSCRARRPRRGSTPASSGRRARPSSTSARSRKPWRFPSRSTRPIATSADATETAGIDEPDLVVTESMAELFLKQGHPADALRIYRELLLRRPEDARLADRVASLEESEAGRSDPLPRYAASASGGTSVRELMRTVLGSRPNGIETTRPAAETVAAGSDTPGTPTRPASDHLTLSAIFGEDAAPLPPMSRKPRAAAALHLPNAAACRSTSSTAGAETSLAPRLARPVRRRVPAVRTTSTSSTTGCRTSSADHAPRSPQRSQPQPAGTA